MVFLPLDQHGIRISGYKKFLLFGQGNAAIKCWSDSNVACGVKSDL